MVKIGIYLPVYGGWLAAKGSAKAEGDRAYTTGERENSPAYVYIRKAALEAEKIGIDSLWIPDHMLNPIKGEEAPSLESWTVITAIAEATERTVIAQTTLCEAFRYPAVLAKQAATLSEISAGRFWLSIGAGWFKREYEAYGLPFYEHDNRVTRAKEAIQIIKMLWERNGVNFNGTYYSIKNGVLEPKPHPVPPVWYAGVSEASRKLVAEIADGWLMQGCTPEEAKRNIEDMLKQLERRGRKEIQFAIPALTFIRDTNEEAIRYMEHTTDGKKNILDNTLKTGLVGSPENVAKKIKRLEGLGINHVLLQLTPTLKELPNVKRVLDILKNI